MKGFYITLYPGPVQDDVYEHQNDKDYGHVKMYAAPLVTIHRPEILGFCRRPAAAKTLAVACRAGRQNESRNKAGKSQSQQVQKDNKIDIEIHRCAFHHAKPKYYIERSRMRAFSLKGKT
jgi:hypothetical protein